MLLRVWETFVKVTPRAKLKHDIDLTAVLEHFKCLSGTSFSQFPIPTDKEYTYGNIP